MLKIFSNYLYLKSIHISLCTNISHMYVGVKLVNYPHFYYFYHFTHFTLYLRMCEKYQVLFKFVLISKFPISIMGTTTLFPRCLEKHKFLLRSIEGLAFLTGDIKNYPCLTEYSTADHYSTTQLQYSVVKIFKNLYKLVVRRLQVHEIDPGYKLTPLHLLDGPLKYFEWSAAIETLCNTCATQSYTWIYAHPI